MGAIHINWIHLCYFTFFSFSESKEGIPREEGINLSMETQGDLGSKCRFYHM